jgi:8-oxo-dGTP pyrophosphatase MutT (NUDIX family)
MADIEKVALLVVRTGCILLCRKKHTTSLLSLPGGRRERGETSLECLRRELYEELGDVGVSGLHYIGTYTDAAAGEDTKSVQIELYGGELTGDPQPRSEIRELVWFSGTDDESLLAPSLRNKILPDLRLRDLV